MGGEREDKRRGGRQEKGGEQERRGVKKGEEGTRETMVVCSPITTGRGSMSPWICRCPPRQLSVCDIVLQLMWSGVLARAFPHLCLGGL